LPASGPAAGLIGASLLSRLDPDAFRLGMGVLLLVFSTSMLLRRSRAGIA